MSARRAFTLIELLVVVAIIGVLVAILLPNLAKAKAAARRAVCSSNLHQLGLATNLYLDSNSGYFWQYYIDQASPQPGRLWWFGFELNGPAATATTNRPLDKSLSPLAPYTANLANLIQCPDFPYSDALYFRKFNQHAASYGYNLILGSPPPAPTTDTTKHRNSYIDRATEVFVFADGVHFDFSTTFNEAAYIQHTTSGPSGYAHFRHQLSAQLVFIDGHVDANPYVPPPVWKSVAGMPTGNLNDLRGWQWIYGDTLP
ncbi:MAG: prepilin-type N-terminal cleavage/methylation domain-containing protein [Phycisphaerales bacterium]|nr:prepilin-type N-terminal cleavage/methylation domain-containing protein [Phycisphaerales bacterium]